MIVLYTTYGNVSSRRARNYFISQNKTFVEKNIKNTRLTEDEIRYLLSRCENGTDDLISTRSTPYKQIQKRIDEMTTSELIQLIKEKPNILKLPLIINEQMMMTGWDDNEIELASRMQ